MKLHTNIRNLHVRNTIRSRSMFRSFIGLLPTLSHRNDQNNIFPNNNEHGNAFGTTGVSLVSSRHRRPRSRVGKRSRWVSGVRINKYLKRNIIITMKS